MQDRPKMGHVPSLDALLAQASRDATVNDPAAELVLRKTNLGFGPMADGGVVLWFVLPFGLKVIVPFSNNEWRQFSQAAAAHVPLTVAREPDQRP